MDVVQYTFFLLFLFYTPNLFSSEALFLSNGTDRTALLQFKAAIGSSSSSSDHVLSSWNETTHFCNWEGITCGRRHQRVTLIDLHGLGLEGIISPYLGNLSFLRGINLERNKFHGQIPPHLGFLHRLEHLNLSYNSLTGQIPINISHCSNLRVLKFDHNQHLEGPIHAQLTTFPKLLVMNLSYNSYNGTIPPSIGNLSTLRYLNLAFNNLAGQIPHSLGRIRGLRFLVLEDNYLHGTVPLTIYNLSFLEGISLAQNQLQGNLPMNMGLALPNLKIFLAADNRFVGSVPISLSNASRLQMFEIGENRFSGIVPSNIGNLRYLTNLGLSDNHLRNDDDLNFLDSLVNCSQLVYLSLYRNFFTGRLSFISNLPSTLFGLDFSENRFYGGLPTNISNLVGLQVLSIQQNFLTGNIPRSIGMLSELRILALSGNNLHGKIPTSICNGSNLLQLYLAVNNLEGQIPSSIGKCNKLLTLQISGNNLNGSIPKGLFTISSLSIILDISNNFLNGTLPLEVTNLKNLGILSVSNNSLTGKIPSSLGSCSSLERLYLQGNFFQGSIPVSLENVRNLKTIDLSQNSLSGPIPNFLGEMKSLESLNLSFNNLSGNVPDKGVFQNKSQVDLRGNELLCGGPILLHLQACSEIHEKKRSKALHMIIILLCCSFILFSLVCFMSVYYWKRKSKEQPSTPILGENHPKVSYQNLMKATNGFSSDSLVGVGRYGSVYKGVLEQEGTIVAIKVLNLQMHGAAKTFNAECKALRNIKHRNLVKIITSCSSVDHRGNNFKALVFEFISNGSLENWLYKSHDREQTSEHLNLVQRLNVAVDVGSALDYLHNQCHSSIIHCDLKPSNILLDDEMVAHVGDFGLAKFASVDSSNQSSRSGSSSIAIKGTIGYVPPEYGIGGDISTCGDVYSYGVIILELFTGKRPTNEVSLKGLSINEYVKHAFPQQVMEIVDPKIFPTDEVHSHEATKECLVSILQVGIACTMMSPHERPTIKVALNDVHTARTSFLS